MCKPTGKVLPGDSKNFADITQMNEEYDLNQFYGAQILYSVESRRSIIPYVLTFS